MSKEYLDINNSEVEFLKVLLKDKVDLFTRVLNNQGHVSENTKKILESVKEKCFNLLSKMEEGEDYYFGPEEIGLMKGLIVENETYKKVIGLYKKIEGKYN